MGFGSDILNVAQIFIRRTETENVGGDVSLETKHDPDQLKCLSRPHYLRSGVFEFLQQNSFSSAPAN